MRSQARTPGHELLFAEFFRLFEQVEAGQPLTDAEQNIFEQLVEEFVTELILARAYAQALRAGTISRPNIEGKKPTTH